MTILNAILGRAIGWLVLPFEQLPAAGLAAVSLLTAFSMLLVIKATSPQARIALVKRQILAGLFEIRLFSDDLRAIFRAQTEVLGCNVRYLGLSLIPVLWMAVPLALLLVQLQSYFGYVGLQVGQPAIVKVRVKPEIRPNATLEAPEGIRVDGPPIWIPAAREMDWRVTPIRAGSYTLTLRLDEHVVTKDVQVSNLVARYSPVRASGGFVSRVIHPVEAPIPAEVPVETFEVGYANREFPVLGWPLHWSIAFLLLTMLFAFVLKGRMGVSF